MLDLKQELSLISSVISDFKLAILHKNVQNRIFEPNFQQTSQQTDTLTHENPQNPTQNPTIQHINPAETPTPTDNPTLPHEIGGLISLYKPISTGNVGVPTDKPTNQQTNQQIIQHIPLSTINTKPVSLNNAQELLAGLDSLKKEVRFKFKRLTSQEMQVFTLLYSLEERGFIVDYKLLSEHLHLSESSIRDYIGKIQKKGIPITKEKLNNKKVVLHISQDLKQIASLQTILKLREI